MGPVGVGGCVGEGGGEVDVEGGSGCANFLVGGDKICNSCGVL